MSNRFLRKFCASEDAAVITEFVILLPVFVITFVAIVNLNKLEVAGSRVKFVAATQMWDDAMAIHDNDLPSMPPLNRALPQLAGANSLSAISNHASPQGDMPAQIKNVGLMAGGSRLEAAGAGVWAGGGTTAYSAGSDFAEDMIKDTTINPLSFTSAWPLFVFNVAVPYSYLGTRQASALGTRYGLVTGESSRSVTAGNYGTVNMDATYDVLVSPTSVGGSFVNQLIISGFSRLAAEDSPCLNSVLKLSNDGDYGC